MKGPEQGAKFTPIDLEEIRRNFRQTAEGISPQSPTIKGAIQRREEADKRLQALGRDVRLTRNPSPNS